MKDEFGWYEIAAARTQRVASAAGHELNRLLLTDALWAERPYRSGRACRGTAKVFFIRHAGQEQLGRRTCGTAGLSDRAAEVARTLRVPKANPAETVWPPSEPRPKGMTAQDHFLTRHISQRLSEMAASWERKSLPGFVDPYAADALVERPEATLRGRNEIVEWPRRLQDWSSSAIGSRLALHQVNMPPAQGQLVYETHETRWTEEGKSMRQTFSALWRNNGGLWQIIHERVGPPKNVEERSR